MRTVSNYLKRLSPSSLLLLALVFLTLFVSFFHQINAITQDLGRHLLTGQRILETASIPSTNLYSYTYPDYPFINHHWLSEVVFFLLQQTVGFPGLLFVMTILVLSAFFLLFLKAGKVASIPVMTAVSILLIRVLTERTDLRPEIFSFFFLSAVIVILYTYREHFSKLILLLPLIQLVWVNTHIYFIVGLGVIALFLVDHLMMTRNHLFTTKNKVFVLIFLLSCFVSLLNPNGLEGLLYPLNVFQNYGYTIEENQTIFFLQSYFPKPTILYFELSVFLLFTSLLFAWKKTRLIDWLLALSFTYLGAAAIRNFPLFVIAVFLPFSHSLSILTTRIAERIPAKRQGVITVSIFIALVFLLLLQIGSSIQRHPVTPRLEKGGEGAVTYFLANNLKGPIFNNFDIGSYLEYRLYPQERVFVDGRPEAYPAFFFQEVYIPMQQNPKVFKKVEKQYGFKTILFSHTDQTPWAEEFLSWITKDADWQITYLDDTMVILEKNSGKKPLTDDPANNKPYTQSLSSLLRLAHFYSVIGWNKSLTSSLQAIITLDPKNCPALLNLALLAQHESGLMAPIYTQQYQAACQ